MTAKKQHELKRVVGMPMLAMYGIGNIVGAGVYVLVGKIAEPAGYLAVVSFIIAAGIAFCAALSYAELAARFPVSAGAAVYLYEAFKRKKLSVVVGVMLVMAGAVSTATLLKGFAGYVTQIVSLPPWLIIAAAGIILVGIMLRGIRESVGVAVALTILEVGGLLFLVTSILAFDSGAIATFATGFSSAMHGFDTGVIPGVIAGAFLAFYAFIGFEDMVNVAEEVKEPQKSFPRAILLSMVVVTFLYIVVTVVVLGVISPSTIGNSTAPLADAYQAATGKDAFVIVLISILATLNGVLANVIMGSRFLYGLARRGWIAPWFGKVSGRHVPARGVLLVGGSAIIAAICIPIEHLAQVTSLLLLCVFAAINVALIIIRRHPRSNAAKEFCISPTFIPWVGAMASIALLVAQIIAVL